MNTQEVIQAFLDSRRAAAATDNTIATYLVILGDYSRFVPTWPPAADSLVTYFLVKKMTCNKVTLHSHYLSLRAFLTWCEKRKWITPDDNPLAYMPPIKRPKVLPKPVAFNNLKQFFQVIADKAAAGDDWLAIRDLAMFRLAYDTGARCSELAAMLYDDLDQDNNSILIRAGKGEKDRVVYFGPGCAKHLQRWLDIRPANSLWLFVSRSSKWGRQLFRTAIYNALQKYAKAAGVKLTVHRLRHSYATHALRQKIDLGYISAQLGHCDISVTAIYLSCDDEGRHEAHLLSAPGNRLD